MNCWIYIEGGLKTPIDVRQQLITQHPLQSFSSKYSGGDNALYSYLDGAPVITIPVINRDKVLDPYNFKEIELEAVARFFRNPFKTYYNMVLGIFYSEEDVLLRDTEIFNIDKLQEWTIKNELLPLQDEERALLGRRLVRKGNLPLSNMAEMAIVKAEKLVTPIRKLYNDFTKGKVLHTVQMSLQLDESLIKGKFENVYDNDLVQISWSKNESKYLVRAYIFYMAGIAAGSISGMYFISANKESVYKAQTISKKVAFLRLAELVEIYKKGFENIATFYPDFEFDPTEIQELDPLKFSKKLKQKFDGEYAFNDRYVTSEYDKGFFYREGIDQAFKTGWGKADSSLVRNISGVLRKVKS